ncbi:hypothetical protein DKX38_029710 [Salix brachista]|uniref:Uncharacterized protein n=1 Tax=Salix brachista TaxID=2182728 RepID=A0A5N5J1G6_9ROSI|nr:hypothetical protein DKX38_029710 [Salix brachista]
MSNVEGHVIRYGKSHVIPKRCELKSCGVPSSSSYRVVAADSHTPRDGKHGQEPSVEIHDVKGANKIEKVKEATFMHIARPARMPQKILLCGWRRDIDDMIVVSSFAKPLIFSFLRLDAAGMERKSTQRLYCSKVCRKDIILWLETRHGRYDYGNVMRIMKS